MRFERFHTVAGESPYRGIEFKTVSSVMRNPDGQVVFEAQNIQVPEFWSQVATDILARKYFRKRGVPTVLRRVEEEGVPAFLWRSEADEAACADLPEDQQEGGETDARAVFNRLAGAWTYWGWKAGIFSAEEDAQVFYDELCHQLARQMAAPNSPQWF